jgi:hypothetical protein
MNQSDNSLHDVLQELMRTHANSLEILTKFSEAFTSSRDSISVNISTSEGQTTTYQIPSIGFLQSELKRLEENIKGLSGLDVGSATLRLEDGTYKRVVATNNNIEPNRIGTIRVPSNFNRRNNWFFDNFINPMLVVSFDVSEYVNSDVRSVWYRRVIVNTDTDDKKQIFDANIKGRNDIEYETLMIYLNGRGINHFVDEDEYKFPPSISQYTGTFDVITILTTDTTQSGNSRLYRLNKLTYTDNLSPTVDTETLKIGDILSTRGGARYRVDEVSKIDSSVRLTLTSGFELITIGTDVLYLVSDLLTLRKVEVSVGYDERQVIFFRPINSTTSVASTKWSPGVAIYSNDLRIRTADSEMGLEDYYKRYCIDFGTQLLDLSKNRSVPKILGLKPDAPLLRTEDFKVVIANEHKIQSSDSEVLRQKLSEKNRLASEIQQLDSAIAKTKEEFSTTNFRTAFDKRVVSNKLKNLIDQKNNLSNLYSTTVRELSAISTTDGVSDAPKYRIRGFFPIPSPKIEGKSGVQNVIQFIVQYRYLRTDGTASGPKSFEFTDSSGNKSKGYYSEWNEYLSPVRKQIYDEITQKFSWANENVNDPDAVNINQVDIPITPNEKVEIRVASVSEAGYPNNPLKSDYSSSVIISFPPELIQTSEKTLLQETQLELNKVQVLEDLNSKGLDVVLNSVFTQGDQTFVAKGDVVASGFVNTTGTAVSVYDKFKEMEQRMQTLQELVTAEKGKLDVYLLDENNNRYTLSNGGFLELNAGYYSEIVQQYPESQRKGAIVTAKYCIVLENLNSTPLELITRFPGGINQRLSFLYGSNNSEYFNRNYHLATVLYNDVATDKLTRTSPYWLTPFMSQQTPSQFLYLRGKALGLTEELYKQPTNDNRYFTPVFPTAPVSESGFVWTGNYNTSNIPTATQTATDFCFHITHPDISKVPAGNLGTTNAKFKQLVYPDVVPTTTNQVYSKVRHSHYFNKEVFDADGLIQLAYKDGFQQNTTSNSILATPPSSTLSNYQDKLGFYPNDRYLIGKKTCGAYLMLAPVSTQQLMVDGTDYRSTYLLEKGEDKAIRIPVLFQFRMTDYYGNSNTSGIIGGYDPANPLNVPTNITYGKKIGVDVYVKDEGVFSFDILIKASYARESLTQVVQSPGFIDRTRRAVRDFFRTPGDTNFNNV